MASGITNNEGLRTIDYNGRNSMEDLGLIMIGVTPLSKLTPKNGSEDVPFSNGDISLQRAGGQIYFERREITYTFVKANEYTGKPYLSNCNVTASVSEIYDWLYNVDISGRNDITVDNTLYTLLNTEMYDSGYGQYKFTDVVVEVEVSKSIVGETWIESYNVTFRCYPYLRSLDGFKEVITNIEGRSRTEHDMDPTTLPSGMHTSTEITIYPSDFMACDPGHKNRYWVNTYEKTIDMWDPEVKRFIINNNGSADAYIEVVAPVITTPVWGFYIPALSYQGEDSDDYWSFSEVASRNESGFAGMAGYFLTEEHGWWPTGIGYGYTCIQDIADKYDPGVWHNKVQMFTVHYDHIPSPQTWTKENIPKFYICFGHLERYDYKDADGEWLPDDKYIIHDLIKYPQSTVYVDHNFNDPIETDTEFEIDIAMSGSYPDDTDIHFVSIKTNKNVSSLYEWCIDSTTEVL